MRRETLRHDIHPAMPAFPGILFYPLRAVNDLSLPPPLCQACDACLAEDPKRTQGIGGDNMTCLVVVFKETRGGSSM